MDVLAHSSSCSSGLAIDAKPSIIVCTDSVKVGQHGILAYEEMIILEHYLGTYCLSYSAAWNNIAVRLSCTPDYQSRNHLAQ
jgi:hypothetical protein